MQSIMGAPFNQFRNHVRGSFLRDTVNISLQKQSSPKHFQYSTTKHETGVPITLYALRV